jgi:hypothetical protein
MRNPWLTKNPFLSMWLSGANTVMGHARAQAHRSAARMMTLGTQQALRAWTDGATPVVATKRAPRKRSR